MCEDWTEGKWEAYHKRIAETKKRSTRSRDGKSHSKVQQGEVLPGANNVPPLDGFGIIPSACTNGSTGVIPSACTNGATGVIPSACTNGASEVKVAQIPSGQSISQQTMLSPTPKGVESPRPGRRGPRPGGRGSLEETSPRPPGRGSHPGRRGSLTEISPHSVGRGSHPTGREDQTETYPSSHEQGSAHGLQIDQEIFL